MYKLLLCSRYMTTRYIAVVSIVSVMLGVATMIIVNGVMAGFREKMRDRLHGILADVILESTSTDGFDNPELVMDKIQEVAGDMVVAMTPAVEVPAMLSYQNNGVGRHLPRPIFLLGIDPVGRSKVGDYASHLMSPESKTDPAFQITAAARAWRDTNAHLESVDPSRELPPDDAQLAREWQLPAAVIGYQIATFRGHNMTQDYYLIHPGQEVNVTTVLAGQPKPVDVRLIVTDLYRSDMSEYDSNYVFMPLKRLQQIRRMGNAVTSIQIRLQDYNRDHARFVDTLEQHFHPAHFKVETWENKQGPLLQAVKVEAAILNIILFFIIAVAGFGILAIFFMIVVEKTRDIGILKALGASNLGVMGIFLGYGLILGLIGCLMGSVFGITFTAYINEIEHFVHQWTGFELFPRDIYYFKEIPTLLDPLTVALIVLGALLIAVGAAVLPARRAARLHPVEALRYE